jgi:DNA-3-methyladenine glycosylase
VGTLLVAEVDGVVRVARIVETEAYRGPTDAACHARVGLTKRTKTLYGAPGTAYVYLIYGMYDCFNVVCQADGSGHAVLVRAVEPVAGEFLGARFDGPGRLTRALGVSRAHDGTSLLQSKALYLASADALAPSAPPRLGTSARVNVAYAGAVADEPWRFFDADSRHVSRPPARSLGLGGGLTPPKRKRG